MKLYKLYREYVKHQYSLINHRTNWYIGFQSFLFAAFGFTIQYKVYSLTNIIDKSEIKKSLKDICGLKSAVCQNLGYLDWMMWFYGGVGIIISLIFWRLLIAASEPISQIYDKWGPIRDKLEPSMFREQIPNITGGYERMHAERGRNLTRLVPTIVMVIWIGILIVTQIFPLLKNSSFLRFTIP